MTMNRRHFLAAGATAGAAAATGSLAGCGRKDEPVVYAEGVPKTAYDKKTTAEQVVAELDLSGRTFLITGGTSGLGLESARVLAARGAAILLTGRTLARAREAATPLGPRARPLALELEQPESIVACAAEVARLGMPLEGLICNAGIMVLGELRQVRGIEQHFAVNHLGHFLLVNRLLGQVQAAPQGRVVVVASSAYKWAPPAGIEFDNLAGTRDYTANKAYGQSKLANALFSFELSRRLAGTPTTSNSVNPGAVDTSLWRHYPKWQQALLAPFKGFLLKTAAQGAATQCYVATSPGLATVTGQYFDHCNAVVPPPQVRDAALAQRLWATSEELLRGYLA
jgi:NAD(P)-dependent dehydrogenase (short-subunit alcohol dehydrogenase family)